MLQAAISRQNSSISHCSYGFFIEDGSYMFTETDLLDFDKTAKISTRLEWSMAGSCSYPAGAIANTCGSNTRCDDFVDGYLCTCLDGYRGNPFLKGPLGCKDIDECDKSLGSSPCVEEANCRNKIPGFKCLCPKGSSGDGRIEGSGCIQHPSKTTWQ